MTPEELQDRREQRAWWLDFWRLTYDRLPNAIIMVLVAISTYLSYGNGTKAEAINTELQVAAKERTEIKQTIDAHTVKLDEAAEHAKLAATEVKAVAAKIGNIGDAQQADSP